MLHCLEMEFGSEGPGLKDRKKIETEVISSFLWITCGKLVNPSILIGLPPVLWFWVPPGVSFPAQTCRQLIILLFSITGNRWLNSIYWCQQSRLYSMYINDPAFLWVPIKTPCFGCSFGLCQPFWRQDERALWSGAWAAWDPSIADRLLHSSALHRPRGRTAPLEGRGAFSQVMSPGPVVKMDLAAWDVP